MRVKDGKSVTIYDVFNGDADGICSLVQLRNAKPLETELVTGIKRDIKLVNNITAQEGDIINVFDVSFDKNREAVERALSVGAEVFYVDHHFAGDIPEHPKLETHINLASNICTSLLVNGYLKGQFPEWAITGAFGDNLKQSAIALAKSTTLNAAELEQLEKLGIYINYNGYGSDVDDLHFHPADLYRHLCAYTNPLVFAKEACDIYQKLEEGYISDMSSASTLKPEFANASVAAYILPNEKWASRVSGVYSNDLANEHPERGHAVLTEKSNGNYLISVRAPLNNKTGADEICRRFPTGGGRAAAAGVNDLPAGQVKDFIEQFNQFYSA